MSFLAKLPRERMREIFGIGMLGCTFFLFLALGSDGYHGTIYQRPLEGMADVYNICGKPGAIVASLLYIFVGYSSHGLYFLTCIWAIMLFRQMPLDRLPLRFLGMFILIGSLAGLLCLDFASPAEQWPGGVFGSFVSFHLGEFFGVLASNVILIMLGFIGILLATEFLVIHMVGVVYSMTSLVLRGGLIIYGAVSRFRASSVQPQRQFTKSGRSILGLRFLKEKG